MNVYFSILELFLLDAISNYTFLTNGAIPVPGEDDGADFQSTLNAMSVMGFNNDDVTGKPSKMSAIKKKSGKLHFNA